MQDEEKYGKYRLIQIDGLRGIAALVVVSYHFASIFYPTLTPDRTGHPFWLIDTPLGILANGPFAVSIFFVLSGFVVSQAAAKARDPVFINVPLRYVRLALPAAVSVIFAWCLAITVAFAAKWSEVTLPNIGIVGAPAQVQASSLYSAIYDGFVRIFTEGTSHFNYPLWTMRIEVLGSILIYFLYGLLKEKPRIAVMSFLALISLLKPNFLCFFIGSALRDLWVTNRLRGLPPLATLCVGVVLGAPGSGFAERMGLPFEPHRLALGASDGVIPPIAAGLILYSILASTTLSRALSSRFTQYLGHISFPLYLVHVPILNSVFAFLYALIVPGTGVLICLYFCLYLVICFATASIGEKCVDAPLLVFIGKIKAKARLFYTKEATVNRKV